VALPAGSSTAVAAVRVRDGRVLRFGSLPGSYGIPLAAADGTSDAVSADGKTLLLAGTPETGPLQLVSRFVLLDARSFRVRRAITLRGDFSFDALSPHASTLYLIQRLWESDLTRYLVRAYDLKHGWLRLEAVADRRERQTVMQGYPLTRVTSAEGRWAYTLYQKDARHLFVHALDTRRARAFCIDLVWRGRPNAVWRLRLDLSDDGRRLVLRGGSGARWAAIDTQTFTVRPSSAAPAEA
jgi:hypothetical protein